MVLRVFRTLIVLVVGLSTAPVVAQGPVEILPDHIARRILVDPYENATENLLEEGRVSRGVVAGAKRWNPGEPISVCFFGGSPDLRRRIVEAASAWEQTGASIAFDFGDRSNPRLCGRGFSQIRVGYSQRGYWSLLGQDSIVYAPQTEQSLNLAMFDIAPPAVREFRQVVLHEFGHAIGFQHEHQHPSQSCAQEFNWPRVYQYLSGPPNYWSRETIDFNLRALPYHHGNVTTDLDVRSIMLYSFPAEFYLHGQRSRCFTEGNYDLSDGDKATARLAYARMPQGIAAAALQSAALSAPTLDPATVQAVNARVALFSADKATQARIVGAVDPRFTDIDVFVCADVDTNNSFAERVINAVRAQRSVGRLRERRTVYPGTEPRPSSVTIVADMAHAEAADAQRLAAAIRADLSTEVSVVPNSGAHTPWLLSVIACSPN